MSPHIDEAQVTRSRFLAGAAALGAAPLALDRLAGSARASAAATAGVLRCSMGSDIRGFDVQRFYDNQSVTLGDALFSRLVRADPAKASRLLPDLAVAVPKPTNGGKTYVFKLRDAPVPRRLARHRRRRQVLARAPHQPQDQERGRLLLRRLHQGHRRPRRGQEDDVVRHRRRRRQDAADRAVQAARRVPQPARAVVRVDLSEGRRHAPRQRRLQQEAGRLRAVQARLAQGRAEDHR